MVPYEAQLVKLNVNWLGHIARVPTTTVMYRLFFWRCQAWRDAQSYNILRTKAAYFSVGRPRAPPDAVPIAAFGPA